MIERDCRYWLVAQAGKKDAQLFERGTRRAWEWAKGSELIRWLTDGERPYAQQLWHLASVSLQSGEYCHTYGYRRVWRQGLEVAIKVKGSQGRKRVEWVKLEHPYTAISPNSEVHANHNQADNSVLRRRCSAYRRRSHTYAKDVAGW